MRGRNMLILNTDTMIAAMQNYLDGLMAGDAPEVIGLVAEAAAGGDAPVFRVELREYAANLVGPPHPAPRFLRRDREDEA